MGFLRSEKKNYEWITSLEGIKKKLSENNVWVIGPRNIGLTTLLGNCLLEFKKTGKKCIFITSDYEYVWNKDTLCKTNLGGTKNLEENDVVSISELIQDGKLNEIKNYDYVFIDDFCLVWNEYQRIAENISQIISEQGGKPRFCLGTIPYAWEWLMKNEDLHAKIKEIPPLFYVVSKDECRNKITKIIPETNIEKHMEFLKYKNEELSYETYVPFFLLVSGSFAIQSTAGAVAKKAIISTTKGAGETELITHLKTHLERLFGSIKLADVPWNTFVTTAATAAGGVLVGLCMGVGMYIYHRVKPDSATIKKIAEEWKPYVNGTPDHWIELAEKEADVKPYQFLQLKDIVTVRVIESVKKEFERKLTALGKDIEDMKKDIQNVKKMEEEIQNVKSTLEIVEITINDLIANSVDPVDRIKENLKKNLPIMPNFVGREEEMKKIIEKIQNPRGGAINVFFVTGGPGVGKSRFVYEVAKELEKSHWFVGIPVKDKTAYLPYKIKLTKKEGQNILLVIDDVYNWQNGMFSLFEALKGISCVILIACRQPSMKAVEQDIINFEINNEKSPELEIIHCEEFKFELRPIERENIEKVISEIYPEAPAEVKEDILRISTAGENLYNPLVAIYAANYTREGINIRNLSTADFLREVLIGVDRNGPLSDSSHVKLDFCKLSAFTSVDVEDFRGKTKPFSNIENLLLMADGYIKSEGNEISIYPEIFADVTFSTELLNKPQMLNWLIKDLIEGFPKYLPQIAFRLANAYANEKIRTQADTEIKKFLEQIKGIDEEHVEVYPDTIVRLLFGGYVVSPEDIDMNKLVKGGEKLDTKLDIPKGSVILNVLSRNAVNALSVSKDAFSQIVDLTTATSQFADKKDEFLVNFYAMCVSNISEHKSVEVAMPWLDVIAEKATATATSQFTDKKDEFLVNFYAMCVSKISERKSVEVAMPWLDVIAEKATATATSQFTDKKDVIQFLANFYAICVSKISRDQSVEAAMPWLDVIVEKATTTATTQFADKKDVFLADFYAICVSKISERKSVEAAMPWSDVIVEKATATATSQFADKKDVFLADFYALCVSYISEHKSVEAGMPWLDVIAEKATATATSQFTDKKDVFLENFYALCVSYISEDKSVEVAMPRLDVIVEKATATATSQFAKEKDAFLVNFYALCIGYISRRKSVEDAMPWLDVIAEKATATSQFTDKKDVFLENFYAMCVSNISKHKSIEDAMPWLDVIVEKATATATSQFADKKDEFLENFYALCVVQISVHKSVEAGWGWFERIREKASMSGEEVRQYFHTALMFYLTQTRPSSDKFKWYKMLVKEGNILRESVPVRDLNARFIFDMLLLIHAYSNEPKQDFEMLCRKVDEIKDLDAQYFCEIVSTVWDIYEMQIVIRNQKLSLFKDLFDEWGRRYKEEIQKRV